MLKDINNGSLLYVSIMYLSSHDKTFYYFNYFMGDVEKRGHVLQRM
jgi:hypothetical protein